MTLPVLDRCEFFDLHQQIVPFVESWAWQKCIVKRRKGLVESKEDHTDTLIALQHPPVYTLGTGSTEEYLHFNMKDSPFEIHRIDCAGGVHHKKAPHHSVVPVLPLAFY
jgi:lipoyl(octanoyl) transferase